MKAAVLRGPNDIVLEDVPVPQIGPNDALIKVQFCGICGSDIHSFTTGMFVKPGQIMGHEFSGEIAEVGDAVTGLQRGDRVTGQSGWRAPVSATAPAAAPTGCAGSTSGLPTGGCVGATARPA